MDIRKGKDISQAKKVLGVEICQIKQNTLLNISKTQIKDFKT